MYSFRARLNIVLLSILFFSIKGNSQFPDFKFEHINENQNLSHNTILDIVQDKEGFIWFGTIDGLNRFDGYTCKVFKHSDRDSSSISSNFIHGLFVDSKGDLWITTRDGGLNKFNKYTEKFTYYKNNPKDPQSISSDKVSAIIQDKRGNYWVSSEGGLDRFYPESGKFKHIILNENKAESGAGSVDKLFLDENGTIWICSLYGLIKFNPIDLTYKIFHTDKNNPNSLPDNFINYVYKDSSYIWITTAGGGLTQFDPVDEKFKTFYPTKSDPKTKIVLGTITPYSKNILIVGSSGMGIFFFDKSTGNFKSIKNNPENSLSISSNHISAIFRDNQKNFWIGTWGGGINKVITAEPKFIKYSNNPFNTNTISGTSVFALYKDLSGNIWIGTSNGLDKLENNSGKIIHYNFNRNKNESLGKNIYGAIYQDLFGDMWFASDALIKLDVKTNKAEYFRYDSSKTNSIGSNNIKCIFGDRKGNIWLGLEGEMGGICKYDFKTKKWTRYLSNPKNPLLVRYIFEDSKGIFWLATTNDGLIKYDVNSGEKTIYKHDPDNPYSISYNDVRQIIETNNGELWLATYGGGIDKFDRESGRFFSIKEKNGLSNNFTYAILEDENENLWISTNYGITKYNRRNNSFNIFTIEDGLQNNEFNTGAFFKAKDGEMLFGGVNGFNRFYPNKIIGNKNIPPVYFTSFKLLDKELKSDTSVVFNKNIKISYFDKFFSVEFAALDFTDPLKNQYEYKLEGFDEGWIKADHRRYASYTNLNPGNYTLKVRGSNNDGVWNNRGAELNITVTPPFWLEWWFISSVVLAMLIILVFTVRYYSTKKLKEQINLLEREKAIQTERERISRDLHDNVGSQLTNIITGIGLAEIYNKSEKEKAENLLTSLKGELRETMTQLRETIWALKSNEMDCDNFTSELRKLIDRHSKFFKGTIHLNIDTQSEHNFILKPLQALYIFRIVQEALTNSVKHSGAENINVSVKCKGSEFSISVKDDGSGIREKEFEMTNGNGIENMKKRAEEIGAKFKINSNENKGVEIIVLIPL